MGKLRERNETGGKATPTEMQPGFITAQRGHEQG